MKTTDVRTTLLGGPCTNDPFLREARKRRSAAFIEVFSGGLHEFLVVAKTMAEPSRQVATHAWGAGGSLTHNVHAGFAAPNTLILD